MNCSKLGIEFSKVSGKSGVDAFKKGWFTEIGIAETDMIAQSLLIENVLHHEQSKYHNILIFDSYTFGRVLVLDNIIQLTEKDEFAYQEMITFLPLNCHPDPKKVLVVGGGDGGVVREVTKHPFVESVTLCEIDERVIQLAKKYLPFTAKGFKSPKLTLHVGDGVEYIKQHNGKFDVIITDSTDPRGVAECLFQRSYYESMKQALKPGGIIASQGEALWIDGDIVQKLVSMAKTLFPVVDYANSYVGSYPTGHLGYMLCGTSQDTNFRNPVHKFSQKQLKDLDLKYYSPDMHRASFALPLYLSKILDLNWKLS